MECRFRRAVFAANGATPTRPLNPTPPHPEPRLRDKELLLEERARSAEENYRASEYLRKELQVKSEAVKALTTRSDGHAAELSAAREEAAARERALAKGAKEREDALSARVGELEEELDAVKDSRERFDAMRRELEEARASLADEKLRAAEAAAELERNFIAEKSRMGKEYERKLEAMRASNDEAIERKYDSNVRLILERNREMVEDLRTHVDASEEMRRETRFATAENAELRREMAIKREMEEQYAARGARQRREIAEHKANAASLSASVARLATEFVAEKTKLEGAARDAVATAADDIASTRAVLAAREKELEKLRKLAAEAVRQRNDVERFIVDSLEVVRSEIAEERRAEAAEAAAREPPPFIRRATSDARRRGGVIGDLRGLERSLSETRLERTGGGKNAPNADALADFDGDLANLSWTERERVLRLLFAKLREGKNERYASGDTAPESRLRGTLSESTRPGFA